MCFLKYSSFENDFPQSQQECDFGFAAALDFDFAFVFKLGVVVVGVEGAETATTEFLR